MVLETILFALSISSVVSTETTGKGLADHAISASRGKDCKMIRGFKDEEVCQTVGTVTVESAGNERPRQDIPPVVPPPKRIVTVSTSIDDMERAMSQRRSK